MGKMDPLVNALNAAITTMTSDVYMWTIRILSVVFFLLILWMLDHFLPGGLYMV
ncbi:hypothetical protein LTR70_007174 [Exophiala xenobiotica]|uniref:Uncharacterized protein n=1 Tax=Lithohypha guttulata TaxID=1690604 RepID=A0ABR0KFR0_9EURO|nr:hypothetical protein LTR24_003261 [Lithohypha guttulata]KAK5314459.1 hypothetical protein LTR70_007174 [Exophiala xenobiotica]